MRFKARRTLRLVSAAVLVSVVIIFIQTNINLNSAPSPPWKLDRSGTGNSEEPMIRKVIQGEQVNREGDKLKFDDELFVGQNETESTKTLFYNRLRPDDDRILAQLTYIPKQYSEETTAIKNILVWDGVQQQDEGQRLFNRWNCRVKACRVTGDRSMAPKVDMIRFKNTFGHPRPRPKHQIWLFFLLESPYHTNTLRGEENVYNWTSTYRHDSTIVAPYEKFVPYDKNVLVKPQSRNYAAGKTKKVAWFVSNCGARNNRLDYAQQLGKHIQVDIYGICGPLKCPRSKAEDCFTKLNKDYKFYLAFESSNCWDYITEKFFLNGLQHDVIPIVMGARPEDYERQAPPDSYIHVDDFDSPKELADYLKLLDTNDELYNKYFQWKGTGEFINTKWWCRACAMLHAPPTTHIVQNPDTWWKGQGVCIGSNSWRSHGYKPKKPIGL